MTFPPKKKDISPKEWNALLEKEADALAEQHSLDKKRVREVFHKMDAAQLNYPGFPSESPLKNAIAFIEPERAIQLFKDTDLVFLMNRYLTYNRFLFPSFAPFYTHIELANLIDDFIEFQKNNKDKIIQTGFPNRTFSKSLWLDGELSRLYFVKLPLDYPPLPRYYYSPPALNRIDHIFNTKDTNEFYSIWIRNPQEAGDQKVKHKSEHPFKKCSKLFLLDDFYFENGVFYDASGNAVAERCEYYKAPMLDFLTSVSDLVEIISIRAKFFNMRIEILEVISNALKKGESSKLWDNCLAIMTDTYKLQKKQVDMLNHVDSILKCTSQDEHESENMRLLMGIPYIHINHPYRLITKFENNSGFGDLIHFIGWNEIELKTGVMNEAKKRLKDFPLDDNVFSYYQLVDKPWIDKFNEVLDNFSIESEKQKERYKEFYQKVYESQDSEFLVPGKPVWIKSKVQEKYEQEVYPSTFAAANQYNAYGQLRFPYSPTDVQLNVSPKEAETDVSNDYFFKCKGDTWEITYEGVTKDINHTKGMFYIAELLKNPIKRIEASLLYALYSKPSQQQVSKNDIGYEEYAEMSTMSGIDALDSRGFFDIRTRISQNKDDIEQAEFEGKKQKVNELKIEKEKLERYLKDSNAPGRQSRKILDPEKKPYDAVNRALKRALRNITQKHPPCGVHLSNSISYSKGFIYKPNRELFRKSDIFFSYDA